MSTVVFCGGTGTRAFAFELATRLDDVTFVVNAYDDGFSTGRIRSALGVVGPSDLGKLVSVLARPAVKRWLAERSPAGTTVDGLYRWAVEAATHVGLDGIDLKRLLAYVGTFVGVLPAGFDAGDLALRNAVLTGARQQYGEGYQEALDQLGAELRLPARVVVVDEHPLRLIGVLTDGTVLRHEWQLCVRSDRAPVARVHLAAAEDPADAGVLSERVSWPAPAIAAREAVTGADALVWAPGTLFSSLVPTAAIMAPVLRVVPAVVPRVLVANLRQEQESTTVARTVQALQEVVRPTLGDVRDIAQIVLCDESQRDGGGKAWGDLIPAREELLLPGCQVHYGGYELAAGVHNSPALVNDLAKFCA
ncbi:MAG: 2-phospho-L-lactate transferase CofD family protein [Pseudonocardiaceae bacterium]